MSRNNKLRRKEKEQKQRKKVKQQVARRADYGRWLDTYEQARDLLDDGELEDARELVERFSRANPTNLNAAKMLLAICQELEDFPAIIKYCQHILKRDPHDASLQALLAGAYLNNGQPMSAVRAFQNFVARSPEDPLADDARKMLAKIEPVAHQILSDFPFKELAETLEERLELAIAHEEILNHIRHGNFDLTIELGEALAKRCPRMIAVKNNLTDAYFLKGRPEKALEFSRQVLEIEPDNFHALSNQAKVLFLQGQGEQAREAAALLFAATSSRPDIWAKKCEISAYFGEDDAVLRLFSQAQNAGATDRQDADTAMLWHFAAAAAARTGDSKTARARWRKALELYPPLDIADAHLDDLDEPPASRNGAWYFSSRLWISEPAIEQLCEAMEKLDRVKGAAHAAKVSQILSNFPGLTTIIPGLLDRGDAWGRKFASMLAKCLKTPESLAALREFCLSKRGPDGMRMELASWLRENGETFPSPTRFWCNGEWIESELMDYEIYDEPVKSEYPPEVQDWLYDAGQATFDGEFEKADRLYERCLQRVGESPIILNNLASNFAAQGINDKANDLIRRIHQQWPEYFFGIVGMANLALTEGDFEKAEKLLLPLRKIRRFHISEFAALCAVNAQLNHKSGKFDGAKAWLNLWRGVDPNDPRLKTIDALISGRRRSTFLRDWFGGE